MDGKISKVSRILITSLAICSSTVILAKLIQICMRAKISINAKQSKKIKIFIIPFSYAITDPWAMMIKFLYAHIAIVAVGCSWGSEYVTCITEFYFLRMGFYS